jgi:hypothetical protein
MGEWANEPQEVVREEGRTKTYLFPEGGTSFTGRRGCCLLSEAEAKEGEKRGKVW